MNKLNLRPTAFVLVSTNHGSLLVNRHDYKLHKNSAYGVGYQLLNTSSFDPGEIDVALELINLRRQHFGDGVVAIDCGANIGVHTIEWATLMHGWGEVIAFEAQERIYYALAGNITLNNCFNARAIWAAVGAENGFIDVPCPDYFVPSSFGSLEIRQHAKSEDIGQELGSGKVKTQPVKMMAIDELGLSRLDFLKIDIEGMEMEALQGAKNTIAQCKPHLLVETIKSNESELTGFITQMGYKTFAAGINLLAIHESDPVASQINLA